MARWSHTHRVVCDRATLPSDGPCVVKTVKKSEVIRRNQQRQLMWERSALKTLTEVC